jgi:2,3-bisphosphoglycerate-dependent phosphoglycerate mutase
MQIARVAPSSPEIMHLKRSIVFISILMLCGMFFVAGTPAQNKKTIILVRHAEKDVSAAADPNDPVLTPEGRQRAERLWKAIKRFKPGALYSTDYKRTRETLAEVSRRRRLEVRTYDPKKPDVLASDIMNSPTKRFLVVGHSNTIPGLVNLLIRKELFKQLDDAEHGVIWVVRLRKNKPPRTEILSY